MKLISIDAGHGKNTYPPSKGVPGLPEFEFNSAVAGYAKALAESKGFRVLLTQPLDGNDTPLTNRTNLAINNKVDLLLSLHADANNDKNVRGFWCFYWHASKESKKLATIWLKHAKRILPNPSRGIRESKPGDWTNFHIVRVPATNSLHKFPAIAIEHGFMTNADDLALLKSDNFRKSCAEVAVKTICEYFNIDYNKEVDEPEKCNVYLDGKLIGEGVLSAGVSYLPVRKLERIKYAVERWDNATKSVYLKTVK